MQAKKSTAKNKPPIIRKQYNPTEIQNIQVANFNVSIFKK